MDEDLPGGYHSGAVRRGGTVVRAAGPWSRNVQALLAHLRAAGVAEVPEYLSRDDGAGVETVRFVPGEAGVYPLSAAQRSDEALVDVARVVRRLHDASAGFRAPEPAAWQYRTTAPVDVDCVGHNDLGPYNVVYAGSRVAAVIDWDFAGPSSRAWDLCYAAHRFVPLSAPRSTRAFGWDPVPDQRARLWRFLAAYGGHCSPAQVLDLLVVRLAALAASIERQVELGDPAYDRQRDERHTDGYREDIAYVLDHRAAWI